MRVFITNLHGYHKNAIEMVAQNMVTDIATQAFDAREFGVFGYNMYSDNDAMLMSRLDGILNALTNEDVLILQSPTWNNPHFDRALINRARGIAPKSKVIIFVHDFPPYMMENQRHLVPHYIEVFNKADVLILPTKACLVELQKLGLTVQKVVLQHFWDHPTTIDTSITPAFQKVINFAGNVNTEKFSFCKSWKYSQVPLAVTAEPDGGVEQGENIRYLGWYREDVLLVNALRQSGGFGLHWSEDAYWKAYMKMNASYKLSLYLVAGLPVIVPNEHPEREKIVSGHLGIAVDSLEEAVKRIESMTLEEYEVMRQAVEKFGTLLRSGGITRKVIADALWKLYEP